VPDYLPTGDELFQTGSFGNVGHYSNKQNDSYIKQTLVSSDMHLMWQWENYLTRQLPVVFQPDAPAALVESINNLHIGTQSPTLAINPEDWYYLR
jgi:peptide/nickel transport system substrate-binding protein